MSSPLIYNLATETIDVTGNLIETDRTVQPTGNAILDTFTSSIRSWFKATDLTSSYSESQAVNTWYARIGNYTASQADNTHAPLFSTSPFGIPCAWFNKSASCMAVAANWLLQVNSSSIMVVWENQTNNTFSRITSQNAFSNTHLTFTPTGSNSFFWYSSDDSPGINGTSSVFSSSATQISLCSVVVTSGDGITYFSTTSFYESDNFRGSIGWTSPGLNGGGPNFMGDVLTASCNGRLFEIIEFMVPLTQQNITDLFSGYFLPKYFSSGIYLGSYSSNAVNFTTGSSGASIACLQFVENSSYTNSFDINQNGSLTTNQFREV